MSRSRRSNKNENIATKRIVKEDLTAQTQTLDPMNPGSLPTIEINYGETEDKVADNTQQKTVIDQPLSEPIVIQGDDQVPENLHDEIHEASGIEGISMSENGFLEEDKSCDEVHSLDHSPSHEQTYEQQQDLPAAEEFSEFKLSPQVKLSEVPNGILENDAQVVEQKHDEELAIATEEKFS